MGVISRSQEGKESYPTECERGVSFSSTVARGSCPSSLKAVGNISVLGLGQHQGCVTSCFCLGWSTFPLLSSGSWNWRHLSPTRSGCHTACLEGLGECYRTVVRHLPGQTLLRIAIQLAVSSFEMCF